MVFDEARSRLIYTDQSLSEVFSISLEPESFGERASIHDNSFEDTSVPFISLARLLLDPDGSTLWVGDSGSNAENGNARNNGSIFRVDLNTNERTRLLVGPGEPEEGEVFEPEQDEVLLDLYFGTAQQHPTDDNLLVIDDSISSLFTLDKITGETTLISSHILDGGVPNTDSAILNIVDIEIDTEGGRYFVGESDNSNRGAIFTVDFETGARELFFEPGADSLEESTQIIGGMTLDRLSDRLLLTDNENGRLLSLDLETRQRTVISSPGLPNDVNALITPLEAIFGMSREFIYIVDATVSVVFAVDEKTGYRVIIAR